MRLYNPSDETDTIVSNFLLRSITQLQPISDNQYKPTNDTYFKS